MCIYYLLSYLLIGDAMVDQQGHALLGERFLQLVTHAVDHRLDRHLLDAWNKQNRY